MKPISSRIYGDGSFGFAARHNGDVQRLWCCGSTVQPLLNPDWPAYKSVDERPCMHRTREDARRCPRREES